MVLTTLAVVTVMAFGLTSLSIGLGATLPSFSEDNPARIANGLGGTLNIILSLLYISTVTLLLFVPARLIDAGGISASPQWARFGWLIIASILAINAAAISLPMVIGLRRWRQMDL
jgi:ABC-2 type transport system permease protein